MSTYKRKSFSRCQVCNEKPATILCIDCGCKELCYQCDKEILHSTKDHKREIISHSKLIDSISPSKSKEKSKRVHFFQDLMSQNNNNNINNLSSQSKANQDLDDINLKRYSLPKQTLITSSSNQKSSTLQDLFIISGEKKQSFLQQQQQQQLQSLQLQNSYQQEQDQKQQLQKEQYQMQLQSQQPLDTDIQTLSPEFVKSKNSLNYDRKPSPNSEAKFDIPFVPYSYMPLKRKDPSEPQKSINSNTNTNTNNKINNNNFNNTSIINNNNNNNIKKDDSRVEKIQEHHKMIEENYSYNISKLHQEMVLLEKQIQVERGSRNIELQKQKKYYEKELRDMNKKYQEVLVKNEIMDDKLRYMQNNYEGKCKTLQQMLDKTQLQLQYLKEDRSQELEDKMDLAKEQIEQENDKFINEKQKEFNNQIKELKFMLQERDTQLNESLRNNEQLCARIEEIEQERDLRINNFEKFQQEYLQSQKQNLELDNQLNNTKTQHNTIVDENDKIKTENEALRQSIAKLELIIYGRKKERSYFPTRYIKLK